MNLNGKILYRNTENKMIGGVCSGLAEYLNLDVSIIRLLAVLALLFVGASFWVYLVALIIVPERPNPCGGPQNRQSGPYYDPRTGQPYRANYDPQTGEPYQNGQNGENGPTGI